MWDSFFRMHNKLKPFPREVMILNEKVIRTTVSSFEEFQAFALHFKHNSYVTVFSDWQRKNDIYDCIPLDIDGDDENEAFSKRKELQQKLGLRVARYVFSGKGQHIYLDFRPIHLYDYFGTISQWLEDKGIDGLVDPLVAKDKRTMIRIPYSINTKTKRFAIPLDMDGKQTLDEILIYLDSFYVLYHKIYQ